MPADLEAAYWLATDLTTGPLWRYRGTTPSLDTFIRNLYEGSLVAHTVRHTTTREFVGLVSLYNANLASGFAYLQVLGNGSATAQRGLSALGAMLLLDKAFALWPLRKVYMKVPEFNLAQVASGLNRHAALEGRLKDHDLIAGKGYDLLTYAIYRDQWLSVRTRYVGANVAWSSRP